MQWRFLPAAKPAGLWVLGIVVLVVVVVVLVVVDTILKKHYFGTITSLGRFSRSEIPYLMNKCCQCLRNLILDATEQMQVQAPEPQVT